MLDLHQIITEQIRQHLAPVLKETAKELEKAKQEAKKEVLKLYSYKDLQEIFGKSKETIWRWQNDGVIPGADVRIGAVSYWKHETIKDFIDKHTIKESAWAIL